ncbi:MAG: hypothetical protein N2C14_05760 [Planctomycetales bacterium]
MKDNDWSRSVAELAADALIDAGLIQKAQFAQTTEVIAEEIFVRLILNDRPDREESTNKDD